MHGGSREGLSEVATFKQRPAKVSHGCLLKKQIWKRCEGEKWAHEVGIKLRPPWWQLSDGRGQPGNMKLESPMEWLWFDFSYKMNPPTCSGETVLLYVWGVGTGQNQGFESGNYCSGLRWTRWWPGWGCEQTWWEVVGSGWSIQVELNKIIRSCVIKWYSSPAWSRES